jgi:trans-aconitate 2-methyltransferase
MTEWHGSEYSQQNTLQQTMAEEQLSRLSLTGAERALDLGCGDGKITAEIAARLPQGSILGVDPSHDMIAFATSRYSTPAHANLRFEVADARRLPYRDEFDLLVSFNALHWVPEQDAALASIRAALKSTGRAWLRMVPQGERESLEDVIERVRKSSSWANRFTSFRKPFVHFTADEYRALVARAGLRVSRLQLLDKAWDFISRDAFVAFAQATFIAWSGQLPESDRQAFITDVLDQYALIAAVDNPADVNTFKFYQMEVELTPASSGAS